MVDQATFSYTLASKTEAARYRNHAVKVRSRPAVALAGAVLLRRSDRGGPCPSPGIRHARLGDAGTTPVPAAAAPSEPLFPAPPDGAVVYSRQLGSDALALGVVPRRASVLAQASVVGPQGQGVSGLSVTFVVQGATKSATRAAPGATGRRSPRRDVRRASTSYCTARSRRTGALRCPRRGRRPTAPHCSYARVRSGARFARSASPKASRRDPVMSP